MSKFVHNSIAEIVSAIQIRLWMLRHGGYSVIWTSLIILFWIVVILTTPIWLSISIAFISVGVVFYALFLLIVGLIYVCTQIITHWYIPLFSIASGLMVGALTRSWFGFFGGVCFGFAGVVVIKAMSAEEFGNFVIAKDLFAVPGPVDYPHQQVIKVKKPWDWEGFQISKGPKEDKFLKGNL